MSIADESVYTITQAPRVADVVGPDMCMDELDWDVRGKLLRCALSRKHRAMQLWSVADEPDEPVPPASRRWRSDGTPY